MRGGKKKEWGVIDGLEIGAVFSIMNHSQPWNEEEEKGAEETDEHTFVEHRQTDGRSKWNMDTNYHYLHQLEQPWPSLRGSLTHSSCR